MDFDLTEEQRALRDSIVAFASRELNDDVVERDKNGTFSRENWKKCADIGLLGLPVPEEYGGGGGSGAAPPPPAR
jgi:alkylation response protein AidB-like acyl-CoA dehydrogenase